MEGLHSTLTLEKDFSQNPIHPNPTYLASLHLMRLYVHVTYVCGILAKPLNPELRIFISS